MEREARDRALVVETLPVLGNCASATLPLQWQQAANAGSPAPGRLVLLLGLAGGISVGTMAVRW